MIVFDLLKTIQKVRNCVKHHFYYVEIAFSHHFPRENDGEIAINQIKQNEGSFFLLKKVHLV